MKFMKVGAVMCAYLVIGCGSVAPPDGGSTGTGPSGNVAKSIEAPEGAGAPLLFEDPNVSGLRLNVYEIDGYPTAVVSGPIGVELPNLPPGATLAEIYKTLHPNEAVPSSALAPLDARVAPLLEAAAPATLAPATPTAEKEASIEKSWSTFSSSACVNFWYNSSYYWQVLECEYVNSYGDDLWDWDYGSTFLGQDRGYTSSWDYLPLQRDDRMLHVNSTAYSSAVRFTAPSGNYAGNPVWIPAYSWAWVRNYGPGPYGALSYVGYFQIHIDNGDPLPEGEIGLTLHRLLPRVQ